MLKVGFEHVAAEFVWMYAVGFKKGLAIPEQVEIVYETYADCPAPPLEPGVELEYSAELS